ncbi:MAG: hypothetical protein KDD67_08365 [Ignavibacteriae bacterium]|nr:hypothetical protein [Ignavibacteriota bacterium]MCB9216681.1 hypothetical protein [Ignavibacteria bacterium]
MQDRAERKPRSEPMKNDVSQKIRQCSRCSAWGGEADEYCLCCGERQPNACRYCGAEIRYAVVLHCPSCGKKYERLS